MVQEYVIIITGFIHEVSSFSQSLEHNSGKSKQPYSDFAHDIRAIKINLQTEHFTSAHLYKNPKFHKNFPKLRPIILPSIMPT